MRLGLSGALAVAGVLLFCLSARAQESSCVACHKEITPGVVADYQSSDHARHKVDCAACHGSSHQRLEDAQKAQIPSPQTCGFCHSRQFEQFKKGKHALAWEAMKAMPTLHAQPMALIHGQKGCGGCHKVGLKTQEEVKELKEKSDGFGITACDSCHGRHLFSKQQAQQPQACQTCHMGFDHPQWEMYSTSKHGTRFLLKQNKTISDSTPAPSCQGCHVQQGNHENRTAWGFLAVRLPMPEDRQWQADRTTILQALGVLDPQGNPTSRLDTVKAVDLCRLDQKTWLELRDASLRACRQCHSARFAKSQLDKADEMIRQADHLLAEGIRIVSVLYQDGIIAQPKGYAYAFPDLLAFHDAPTSVEQKLFLMFMEYRMRAFQGAFHQNPDYAFWYGWSSLQRTLTELKEEAQALRRRHLK